MEERHAHTMGQVLSKYGQPGLVLLNQALDQLSGVEFHNSLEKKDELLASDWAKDVDEDTRSAIALNAVIMAVPGRRPLPEPGLTLKQLGLDDVED